MKLSFVKRRSDGEAIHSQTSGVIIQNWMWGAVKKDADVEGKSEHWVVKKALRQYLTAKGYTAEQFAKVRGDEEEGEE